MDATLRLEGAMAKPCSVCRKWFEPNPRAVKHAKTCSPDCRRELHRRRCCEWHVRNPDYDREDRLRRKVAPARTGPPPVDPLAEVDWSAARDAVGLEVQVVVEEAAKVLVRAARDAVPRKVRGESVKPRRLPPQATRDAVGPRGPSP